MTLPLIVFLLLLVYSNQEVGMSIDDNQSFIIEDNILFGSNSVYYLDTSVLKSTLFYKHGINQKILYAKHNGVNKNAAMVFTNNQFVIFQYNEYYSVQTDRKDTYEINSAAISRQFGMVDTNSIVIIEQLANNEYYFHKTSSQIKAYYSYSQVTCVNDNDFALYCCYCYQSVVKCSVINSSLSEERVKAIDINFSSGWTLRAFQFDQANKIFYLCVIINDSSHQCWKLKMSDFSFVTNKDDHVDFDTGGYTIEGKITNNFIILTNDNLKNIPEDGDTVSTIKIMNNYFRSELPYKIDNTFQLYTAGQDLINLGEFIYYESYVAFILIYSNKYGIYFIPYYISIDSIAVQNSITGVGEIKIDLFYMFYPPELKNEEGASVYAETSIDFDYDYVSPTATVTQNSQTIIPFQSYYYDSNINFYFQSDYSTTYTIKYKMIFGSDQDKQIITMKKIINYQCSENCIQCSSLVCTKCKDSFYLDSSKQCKPCKSQCKTCINSSECTSCAYPPYYFYNNNCVTSCPAKIGIYNDNSVMKCANCKSYNKYYLDGKCVDKTKGYYVPPNDQYNIYHKCHSNCTACENSEDNCQECKENFVLFNETRCYDECKGIQVGSNKCYNCIDNFAYFPNQGCIDCLSNENYYQLDTDDEGNKCYTEVLEEYYADENRKMHKCDFRCLHCTINATHCDSCKANYYLYREACIDDCDYFTYKMNCYNCEENEGFYLTQCEVCESYELYINVTSLSNECVELVDEYYADEKRYIHRCDSAIEGCLLCDSAEVCKECKEGFFLYENKCVLQCPLTLIEDRKRKICYSCKSDNLFLNYTSRTCIEYFSSGYYLRKDANDNVLYPCLRDCRVELPNEGENNFCKDKNVYHKCYSEIKIDSELTLHYNPFNIDSQIFNTFSEMKEEDKTTYINSMNKNIDYDNKNLTKLIEDVYILNAFVSKCDNEEEQLEYYEKTISMIKAKLTCDNLFTIIGNDTKILIYISSLFVYQTVKTNSPSEDDISVLSLIEKCLIEKAINEYNETNLIWMQNDFFKMSTKSTDSMLSTLEKSNNESNSKVLLLSDSRKNNKEVIEGISKMQNSFNDKDKESYKNFEFIIKSLNELHKENYIDNKIIITTSTCNDTDKIISQLEKYKLDTKICLPYENIKLHYPQIESLSVIRYNYYPLLNSNSANRVSKSFTAIILRDHNHFAVDVNNLTEPIVIIQKKPYPSFNECIFYDDTEEEFNNTECNSTELNAKYIMCSCYHLTDFSLSKYNPIELAKDIIKLFQQARFINSFKQFMFLNASNATVLYVISSIVVIYLILLIFAIKHDKKEGDSQFVLIVEKEEKCCEGSKDETENELKELDDKIRKYNNRRTSQIIEMKTFSDNSKLLSIHQETNAKTKDKACCSLLYTYYLLLKEFFTKEYWFCTFINSENEMSKVNILTVFFIRLVVSLSICSIFTECSSIEESSEDLYNNRDLAVSVATILIMEIPFTFLEVMLNKTKISEKYLPLKKKIIVNTKYRHTLVYILFVLMLLFGTVNTLWISLDSYKNDYECNFMTDFFISTIFDCFIFQIVNLLLKSLIYIVIIKGRKNNCIRGCLICVVSSLPWIFNL